MGFPLGCQDVGSFPNIVIFHEIFKWVINGFFKYSNYSVLALTLNNIKLKIIYNIRN